MQGMQYFQWKENGTVSESDASVYTEHKNNFKKFKTNTEGTKVNWLKVKALKLQKIQTKSL